MLPEALLVTLAVQHGASTQDCLSEAKLRAGVERRLKRRVFVEPARAGLKLEVAYERRGSEVEARITITSADGTPRGTRSLVTEGHCSRLDDSLALSVALLVDQPPEPEPPSPAPPPTSPSAPPAPARRPATAIEIPRDVSAAREPWQLRLGVALLTAFRVLPDLKPGLGLNMTVVPHQFVPLTLQAEAFGVATSERDARSGARFRLLRAGLGVCPELSASSERSLSACFGQKLAWMTVQGFGFDRDARQRSLGFSLAAGAAGRLQLVAPVWLRGYLGAEVPLVRDSWNSGGRGPTRLFRASPVAIAGEIGAEVRLW